MSDFRKLSDSFWASPQIAPIDIATARELGIATIINNRPDGESDDQVCGSDIEEAANEAGIDYLAIPVTHAGFSEWQVDAMKEALAREDGKVLAYCRSGTRSTLLWALACSKAGGDTEDLAKRARAAGYDLSPVRQAMDVFSASNTV